jgi:hypothetical protein
MDSERQDEKYCRSAAAGQPCPADPKAMAVGVPMYESPIDEEQQTRRRVAQELRDKLSASLDRIELWVAELRRSAPNGAGRHRDLADAVAQIRSEIDLLCG